VRAPLPEDEHLRLETLHRYQILDTPQELSYEDLTLLASEICGTPIAAISLVDEDRQWFKSILGLDVRQTSRDVAFCAHAILDKEQPLVVEDATQDARFSDNALVSGEPGIRFYAGTPLVMSDGHAIGTLCVIDRVPKTLTPSERRALQVLGREVVAQLELRRHVDVLERTVVALERTQAELRRTQREQLDLKDQFVSHVSHELRSPLTPIYQFVTILLDEIAGPLNDSQREYLGVVLRNAHQLCAMIDDLLDVTRAQTGKLRVDRRRMRLDGLIVDLVSTLSISAGASGLTLAAVVDGPLPEVIADAGRVRQVLSNLIENAIKFTNDGGRITVHASVPPDQPGVVLLGVQDTGCGLSAEDGQRVFEQLYQAENAGERSRNGLGLGLHIAKTLVERMGGRIWVESTPGQGSRFSFTLPIFTLAPSLVPLLTPENLSHGTFAVITIDFVNQSGQAGADEARRAMHAAWESVQASVHPSMDVVLPRFGSAEAGETFVVVAMADDQGAARIVQRIEQRVARCDAVRAAGYTATLSRAVLCLPDLAPPADRDALAVEMAKALSRHLDVRCQQELV